MLPLLVTTSCSFIDSTVNSLVDIDGNNKNAMFAVNPYDYKTGKKVSLSLRGMEDYKFNVSTDKFYVSKTIKFSDGLFGLAALKSKKNIKTSEKELSLE